LVDDAKALSDYLASRSWPEEVAKTFGLQIMRDEFGTKRVRHPFYAWIDGTLTEAGWQARRLDNSQDLRWLGAKDTPLPLYNLPALEADDLTHAVICEGPADTITAALACSTLPGWACVGVAGAQSWRDEWAQLFAGLSVVIATDNDAAGEKLSARITASLGGVASLIVAACPTANDLGDMAKAQSIEAVRELLTGWHIEEKQPIGSDTSEEENAFNALVRQLTHAFTRCKVCMHEAEQGSHFCKSCASIEQVSGRPWRVCDTCNTFALVERERKCFITHKCTGSFVDALAVVEAVAS
jgi:5S rRNA maturation endonuclease (ribonuclease M5)